jgi:hypothetical protein
VLAWVRRARWHSDHGATVPTTFASPEMKFEYEALLKAEDWKTSMPPCV